MALECCRYAVDTIGSVCLPCTNYALIFTWLPRVHPLSGYRRTQPFPIGRSGIVGKIYRDQASILGSCVHRAVVEKVKRSKHRRNACTCTRCDEANTKALATTHTAREKNERKKRGRRDEAIDANSIGAATPSNRMGNNSK